MNALAVLLFIWTWGGIAIGLYVTTTAPHGYQDEKGFHFGTEPVPDQPA